MKIFARAVVSFFLLLFGVSLDAASARNEKHLPISKSGFDAYFKSAKVVLSVKFESVHPTFPVDDLPQGGNVWRITGEVVGLFKGTLKEKTGQPFDATVSIYQGPVRSRPVGFWVNEMPVSGQTWVILSAIEPQISSVAEIFKANQGTAIEFGKVKPYLSNLKPSESSRK